MTILTRRSMGIRKSDNNYDNNFRKPKNKITQAPILVALDSKKDFRDQFGASQTAFGGTLRKMFENTTDLPMNFYSKIFSPIEAH